MCCVCEESSINRSTGEPVPGSYIIISNNTGSST